MTIGPSDLEAKLREIQHVIDETKGSARNAGVIAAAAVVVVLVLVFLLGRRRGAKATQTRIQIVEVPK